MRQAILFFPLLLTGLIALPTSPLSAQATPASEILALPSWRSPDNDLYLLDDPAAAPLASGGFVIVREGVDRVDGSDWDDYTACSALILDASGAVRRRREIEHGHDLADTGPDWPVVAPQPDGGFVTVWSALRYGSSPLFLQRFTPEARPWTEEPLALQAEDEGVCTDFPRIAANASGDMAVVWEHSDCLSDHRIALQLFGADGARLTPRILLGPEGPAGTGSLDLPRIGIDRFGHSVAMWREGSPNLRGQRFDRDGNPLGPRIMIGHVEPQGERELAVTDSGSFLAAWDHYDASAGWTVRLQWYTAAGLPERPPLDLSAAGPSLVALAADRRGNFTLLRRSGPGLMLELFNRDLIPQGAPLRIGQTPAIPAWGPQPASLALSDTGRLLTVWAGGKKARVWQARHEADACVRRADRFLCDTANDGDTAEAELQVGQGHPQEIPFLADWDGDGRADPCLYRGGRFFCDTGHDGGTDVRSPMIGTPGDLPLLGDLNGDGRADPCVRRGAAVLCDLARDGGPKDLRIAFGTATDKVLLGDPDGDGRDEPCLLRAGRLLCDAAQNGNLAELKLDLRPLDAQGPTLFGDVNGDGRDEACRFTGDRFLCGVYPPGGGAPVQRIEIVFGQAGDVPLLGDLDAF